MFQWLNILNTPRKCCFNFAKNALKVVDFLREERFCEKWMTCKWFSLHAWISLLQNERTSVGQFPHSVFQWVLLFFCKCCVLSRFSAFQINFMSSCLATWKLPNIFRKIIASSRQLDLILLVYISPMFPVFSVHCFVNSFAFCIPFSD